MAVDVEFIDNSATIKNAISSIARTVLEEVAGDMEAQVKRNTAVKTGQTKNSWQHMVSAGDGIGEYTAVVGSDYENAIWEEFGTGEYALNGDGKKGGWSFQTPDGQWHHTFGKPPRRPLWNAFVALKDKMIAHIQDAFAKGLS